MPEEPAPGDAAPVNPAPEDPAIAAARRAALDRFAILDTPPEQAFDDAVALVRTICDVPIALVSLVDTGRQWFKARLGTDASETPLDTSVCALAIRQDEVFVITDLATDPRTAGMSLVTGDPHIRFYAGAPLVTSSGVAIGSLCAIDVVARPGGLTARQEEALLALGRQVVRQIELRTTLDHHAAAIADVAILDTLLDAQHQVADTGGDLDAMLAALAAATLEAIRPADGVVIETRDGDALVYRVAVGSAAASVGQRLPVTGTLSGRCFTERTSRVIADAEREPDIDVALVRRLGMRAMIVLPLMRHGTAFGILKIHARQVNAFGARHALIGQMLAGLIAARFSEAAEAAALAQVAREQERNGHILDSAIDSAIISTDEAGRVTSWNKGAEMILGWSLAEMAGTPIDRIFTPEDRAAGIPAEELILARDTGRAPDERWHLRKDGTRFYAHGAMTRLEGGERGFVKSLRDITREHQTRAQLAESREWMDAALATGLIGFFDWDVPQRLIRGDARFADFFALDPATAQAGIAIERAARDVHPADRGPLAEAVARTLDGCGDLATSFRLLRAGQEPRWIMFNGRCIASAAGEALRYVGTVIDMTIQHEAEERLRFSQERLELATRAAGLGSFDYLPQAGVLDWDDRCRALFGLPPGAEVSYEGSFLRGLHPDDRERAAAAVAAALDPADPGLFDTEYRTIGIEDGVERVIAARGLAFFEDGLPIRLIGTVLDVSDSRREQEALRQTEERLRLAVRATNDAIWDWDLVRDSVLWNEALESSHGYTPDLIEPTGAWWIAQIHPEDRVRIEHSIHAVIGGSGNGWTAEYRFRRANGSYADIRDRGFLIRDGEGRPIRMLGAMLDQSDRKATERMLAETVEERTRERDQIWRATPDMLCVASLDGWFLELNPAWAATLGWTEAELRARPFDHFIHPDDLAATTAAMRGLAEGGSVFGFENRYRGRDGQYRWFSWNSVARDSLIYAVVRDVTAAHEQAEALSLAEERLRQAQKMEAVGQLTGGLAHDFNNLLAGISGSIEMSQTRIRQNRTGEIGRYLEAALGGTRRAAALTHRLLAFSRRQTLSPSAIDVNRLVFGLEDLVRRTIGPEIGLEIVTAEGLWPTLVDPNQLENALLNLCINARDAMPDGGRLVVETGMAELTGAAAVERGLPAGAYVSLCVSDTGSGMSREVIERAFDPFFTTKPLGQGTGLGLSMIYGFARQSDGQVHILSEVGRGTSVCIYLPRHLGEADAAAAPAAPGPAASARAGETVLVVDDEATVRMLVVDALEELGYAAIEAGESIEALALLRSGARIDLLVTDVGLPGPLNGRQLADAARALRAGLKTLFITGYAEHAVLSHGQLEPGMEILTKPFTMDVLATRIRAIMAG